jgi:hypothetical protein
MTAVKKFTAQSMRVVAMKFRLSSHTEKLESGISAKNAWL